jgi:hypothetical protein
MLILIDENLPPQLADGLNILQQPLNMKNKTNHQVLSIKNEYGEGCKDEEWIPDAGTRGAVVITKDYRIQTNRHQRDLFHRYGLGMIFFNIPKGGLPYWTITTHIISRWEQMLHKIDKDQLPFAYRFTVKSKTLEKI